MKSKLTANRTVSFIIVGAVYALAAITGIITYRLLSFSWWLNLLLADMTATVLTFIFSVIFKNASVYDPYWSVQPIVILFCFALTNELTPFRLLLLAAVTFWGVRLTANWAYTFKGLTHQDWRYTMLKEQTGVFYPIINFVGIHMVPTLIVYSCTLPAVYAFLNPASLSIGSVVFIYMSVFAAILQGVADIQMHRFARNKTGIFIRQGLWKYSRHPNYLGEILMWWGVGLSVVCAFPHAWYLLAGAFANTLLFLIVSIPMADNKQSRKEGFDQYKKETRMLLPIKKL